MELWASVLRTNLGPLRSHYGKIRYMTRKNTHLLHIPIPTATSFKKCFSNLDSNVHKEVNCLEIS